MVAPSDSKSPNILPTSQLFNVGVGQGMCVQGTEVYKPALHRPSALRRALRGLGFIIVSILLCRWIYASIDSWIVGRHGNEFDVHDNLWHYDIPPDLVLDDCVHGFYWAKDKHSIYISRISFDLPLSTDNLFVISRGWQSGGVLALVTSPDQAKDTVTVNVVANYHSESSLVLAKACLVSRSGNQQGVGIFRPIWKIGQEPRKPQDSIYFSTTVVFPESSDDSSVVAVKSFETDVPNTSHYVKSLESKITFDSVSLKGSNANIIVQTLSATRGSVHTSNGPIMGSFNSTTSLYLNTSNGAIQADVGLLSDSTESILDIRTSNANIDVRLHLTSSTGDGGKFDVSTITSNGPIFAIVTDAPVDSSLSLEAKTSDERAHVSLHPTYEGSFDVGTSKWFSAKLNILPAADPSGEQRRRATLYQGQGNLFFGTTSWQEEGRTDTGSGKVNVHTSNAAVVLDLLGI